jgi:hypothetical protein
MTWFKVDDGLHAHRKAVRAGVPAMGLWVLAGSWSADQLTDGWVPDYIAARLDPDYAEHARSLVASGLWTPGESDGDTGWWFHQWAEQQPSREQVLAERKAAADRQRRARERARERRDAERNTPRTNPGSNGTSHAVTHAQVTPLVTVPPTRPDPTRTSYGSTEPKNTPSTSSTARTKPPQDDPDFERFWAAYPRKVAKPTARKAWTKAIKTSTAEAVIRGALRYRNDPTRSDEFTAHPSTWLNQERWNDQPTTRTRTASNGGDWWNN